MRFADRVTFIQETGGGYNPDTGRHEPPEIRRETLPCNLSYVGIDRQKELFGQIDRATAIVRLRQPYSRRFDYAEIEGRRYALSRRTPLRSVNAFYLEEVPKT
ncbi:hypothetical protein [Edaphobacillus lindanitolerans]|uniref:Phage head-tail adaptor, putative, SPP1 family n=1 Tax=Edaphobacillus lindanitolerans TaxID=550447 RepID=A0A1U7PR42_9BACI|nr:hypothetical protein [Edaphobacillus lindanitolerans]SIT91693.1 hypothetical protein SAMN05428946_2724 [Edaphobacillus lindanitolerans]